MTKYIVVTFNGPTGREGDAEALEHWYATDHLPKIHADEENLTARRYKLVSGNLPGMESWSHCSVYEFETDDVDEHFRRTQESTVPVHPAMDRSRSATVLAFKVSGED